MSTKGDNLTPKEIDRLYQLILSKRKQSNKILDKRDNCFQRKSLREIEQLTGMKKSTLQRLFAKLKKLDLTRNVIDATGNKVLMLSPQYSFNEQVWDGMFKKAMYELRAHDKACKWAKACREDGYLYDYTQFDTDDVIDFDTGEVLRKPTLRKLTPPEVRQWESYTESYSCTDRTKRRTTSPF